MFYQSMLFVGYLYAYGIVRFLSQRSQVLIHGSLIILALANLPVLPQDHWKPTGTESDPALLILGMLLSNVGLPFAILAATGPLVQTWFSRCYPDRSPYPLYAVSNLGSLSALLCFPLLVEPLLPMRDAASVWSAGFGFAALIILGCAFMAMRATGAQPGAPSPLEAALESEDTKEEPSTYLLWLLLPATAVILLLAITNKLCLDLASFPFLWIVPLGLYLGSFILSFASDAGYNRVLWSGIALVSLLIKYGLVLLLPTGSIPSAIFWSMFVQVPLFGLVLFSLSMLLHGELYRLRPPPRRLTSFYIGISGGGALGGLFVGLAAPNIFNDYFELHVGYSLAFILLFIVLRRDESSWISRDKRPWRATLVAAFFSAILLVSTAGTLDEFPGLLLKERNFFGIHRVIEWDSENPERARRVLRHGTTVHGAQLLAEQFRKRPISYYGVPTGIGLSMRENSRSKPMKIGIVGMGAGSLAAYGQKGDLIRFYEIDPTVIEIASDGNFFSFLSDTPADIEIIQGDARLSLERELASGDQQAFNLLVIDAFSSDSIPFHLMTLEAFQVYREHLAPEGIIAIHVSNRHFRLGPVLYKVAEALALSALNVDSPGMGMRVSSPAEWILFARSEARLDNHARIMQTRAAQIGIDPSKLSMGRIRPELYRQKPIWTDDFNSILDILVTTK
ncbi:MAG: fused MFS/spermidine synthase [Myxococcota bacterium]|nr:fused MFS/spermidine synthase [Myxococcota bacterium]